jgi:hypothetical protein
LESSSGGRSTINLARQVGRAFKGIGFGGTGTGNGHTGNGKTRTKTSRPAIKLYPDPTTLEGPEEVVAEAGHTHFISYEINAIDGFVPDRGALSVTCDHPGIRAREITIGRLRHGRIRVSIAVPADVATGSYKLIARLADWFRASGGIGPTMTWTTALEVGDLDHTHQSKPAPKDKATIGDVVPLFWDSSSREDWTAATVGEVEELPASEIAAARPDDYAALAVLGEKRIHAVTLNVDYGPLKKYLGATARELTSSEGVEARKDRYAVAVATGLLHLYVDDKKLEEKGEKLSASHTGIAQRAIARAVLAGMPSFDQLLKTMGGGAGRETTPTAAEPYHAS